MHWLYHSFILHTGSYMIRQQPAIIRELIRSSWVTLKYKSDRWYVIQCVDMWPVCQIDMVLAHTRTSRSHTLYDIPPIWFVFQSNSGGSNKLPDVGRLLPKYVGWRSGAVCAYCWSLVMHLIVHGTNIKFILCLCHTCLWLSYSPSSRDCVYNVANGDSLLKHQPSMGQDGAEFCPILVHRKSTITICHIVHIASRWRTAWQPETHKAKMQNKLLN
jgi:hypothetical protein